MSSNKFLMAAYIVTWAIHIGYILHLGSRAKRLAQDIRELQLSQRSPDETH